MAEIVAPTVEDTLETLVDADDKLCDVPAATSSTASMVSLIASIADCDTDTDDRKSPDSDWTKNRPRTRPTTLRRAVTKPAYLTTVPRAGPVRIRVRGLMSALCTRKPRRETVSIQPSHGTWG
jgi:hypothetical protein